MREGGKGGEGRGKREEGRWERGEGKGVGRRRQRGRREEGRENVKGEEGRGKSLVGCRSSLLIVACGYSLALLAVRSLVVIARLLLVVARRWSPSEGQNERVSERMSDLASERMSDGARQPQQTWLQNRSVAHYFNRWSAIHSLILGGECDRAICKFGTRFAKSAIHSSNLHCNY